MMPRVERWQVKVERRQNTLRHNRWRLKVIGQVERIRLNKVNVERLTVKVKGRYVERKCQGDTKCSCMFEYKPSKKISCSRRVWYEQTKLIKSFWRYPLAIQVTYKFAFVLFSLAGGLHFASMPLTIYGTS